MGLARTRTKSAFASLVEAERIKLIEITENKSGAFAPWRSILAIIADARMNRVGLKNIHNLR
jgi:hypothetical protein